MSHPVLTLMPVRAANWLDNAALRWSVSGAIIVLVLAGVLLVLGALVSVLRSAQSGGMKLVWCAFVLVAPFLGSLLWFLIGRSNAAHTALPRH
ncbi:MAG TPA: PLD nuclease N-terminal domain-containing protein [Pseudonocardiaceae bacterium]|jgi:hypothetical protein|nr:PLD nuclease N-terminal domain-containing protein [Pseudonocardiaceae bacterium]